MGTLRIRVLLLIGLLSPLFVSNCKADGANEPAPFVCVFPEVFPEFPGGGDKALLKFLASHIEWPAMDRDACISGKVLAKFTVDTDGCVRDIQILRAPAPEFGKEAMRVLSLLPKFKPATCYGRPTTCQYCIPVRFGLD